jgi:hypothetical protein
MVPAGFVGVGVGLAVVGSGEYCFKMELVVHPAVKMMINPRTAVTTGKIRSGSFLGDSLPIIEHFDALL